MRDNRAKRTRTRRAQLLTVAINNFKWLRAEELRRVRRAHIDMVGVVHDVTVGWYLLEVDTKHRIFATSCRHVLSVDNATYTVASGPVSCITCLARPV